MKGWEDSEIVIAEGPLRLSAPDFTPAMITFESVERICQRLKNQPPTLESFLKQLRENSA